jgi:hypothetical protein
LPWHRSSGLRLSRTFYFGVFIYRIKYLHITDERNKKIKSGDRANKWKSKVTWQI